MKLRDQLRKALGEQQQEQDAKIDPALRCCECNTNIIDGYYGVYELGDGKYGGVCSKACDILHMKKKSWE